MTTETDKILEQLIVEHGVETVRTHFSALIPPRSRWADWQRLNSSVTNIANRIERNKVINESTHGESLQAQAQA